MGKVAKGKGRIGRATQVKDFLEGAMPRQYAERLKLSEAERRWPEFVGKRLGASSTPVDVAGGELLIAARTPAVANRLVMMGGNIEKTLKEKLDFDIKKVRVVVANPTPLPKTPQPYARRRVPFNPKKEEVEALSEIFQEAAPNLPKDVAESLARLRLFFAARFTKD
ncbi:hypothetical protein AGMMS50276_33410 [Synergistales bacterium]|nr:hypothetical protein AGMMS50276_33410 [Synergistales bacterium]